MFEIIPFLLIFHEQKKKTWKVWKYPEPKRSSYRAEQGQLMMILESLVWIIGKFNENTRR